MRFNLQLNIIAPIKIHISADKNAFFSALYALYTDTEIFKDLLDHGVDAVNTISLFKKKQFVQSVLCRPVPL